MDVHKNARTTPLGRAELVRRVLEDGQPHSVVAAALGITEKTVGKWVQRFLAEGADGLRDRSSRPHRLRAVTSPETTERIIQLRRERLSGDAISALTGVSAATVSRVLRRVRLSRVRDLDPPPPVIRYERKTPGELIHLDIKKLGRFGQAGHRVTGSRAGQSRGAGWECVHVCIDDASRVAFSLILPDETQQSAVAFLKAAVAYYAGLGVKVRRVMTDNGACYTSITFRQACAELGLKHIRTKPYTPRTNGKAERFIQTALREWAYARSYASSDQRAAELPNWLHRYNWRRPHGGINSATPISRLGLDRNNLLTLHS
jgi:transposase InsO family protein